MGVFYAAVSGSLLVWMGLAWVATRLMGVTGLDAWIVWAALSAMGVLGAALVAWWKMRSQANQLPPELRGAVAKGEADEIDLLVRDAEARLAASRLAKGSIGTLPVVF